MSDDKYVEDEEPAAGLEYPDPPAPKPTDIVRRNITYALILLIAILAIGAGVIAASHRLPVTEVNELLDRLFTPIVVLAGTATGFYFAERRRD
jgi:uncharacterized protein YneF (UPF0154 family)